NQKSENIKQTLLNQKTLGEEYSVRLVENKNNCELCLQNIEKIRKDIELVNIEMKEQMKEHDLLVENKKITQENREKEGSIISNIENNNKEYYKVLNDFQNKIHELEISLSQRETRIASIFENVCSRYSLTQEDFIQKKWIEKISEEIKNDFSKKNIEELKEEVRGIEQRIKSIGPVNINAIDEFKEVSERFDFLNTQKKDLEIAEQDLMNVINKINSRAKEKFIETFYKVNENFKVIIKQLFEGGEAELSLIDESDVLESGIEINVRPPGKKIQNIMLLSGGEKAMAAIGLLFALFKVKPSPFCILDEIDAPLDDANISRFLKLLKDFSQNSQFVIITHHKKTMATCDVLYGITMEEKGISKVLSVKITDNKKIEELAG
ncbi:AAA family ATPase, partial [Candidatus Dependentiae bacterium]|nr:AAA family ATPase [Candidatus Dependentiae bacterium]